MQFKAKKIIKDHAMLYAEQIEWFAKNKKILLSATHHSFPEMRNQMVMLGPLEY